MNCLRFIVSFWRTSAKCSGANVGIPLNCTLCPGEQIVSPIEKMPGSNTPMMSPAYASSTISLSWAIICCGCERRIFLLPWTWNTSIFFSNLPLQMRINATLSRWALFMFAWILKTNAEKKSDIGSTFSSTVSLGRGGVVSCKNCSRNGSTPKFVRAEPKNTGVSWPLRTASRSNSSPAPSRSSISSNKSCLW